MNIYEYQAKGILKKYGLKVPDGKVTSLASAAEDIAKEIGQKRWVVKAQILAGGRGKAGGIKIANSPSEAKKYTEEILGTPLKTIQTGSVGKKVKKVLIEECCDIKRELYHFIFKKN